MSFDNELLITVEKICHKGKDYKYFIDKGQESNQNRNQVVAKLL